MRAWWLFALGLHALLSNIPYRRRRNAISTSRNSTNGARIGAANDPTAQPTLEPLDFGPRVVARSAAGARVISAAGAMVMSASVDGISLADPRSLLARTQSMSVSQE